MKVEIEHLKDNFIRLIVEIIYLFSVLVRKNYFHDKIKYLRKLN